MTKATSLSDATALRDEVALRRVRQFGSARDGLREWRLQRLTAIAVIPLSLYFAASILSLATSDRKTAADWLSLPVPVLVAILVVLAGISHALIGIRSVVLDYVHARTRLLAAKLLSSITQPCKASESRQQAASRFLDGWAGRTAERYGENVQRVLRSDNSKAFPTGQCSVRID